MVLAQVSEWLSSSRTTTGPLHNNGGTWQGEDAGHSLSFFRRMWFHTWFSGAACARCQQLLCTAVLTAVLTSVLPATAVHLWMFG